MFFARVVMSDSRNSAAASKKVRKNRNSKRVARTLCAISTSVIAGDALANSGIQLPLSQYQAGQEHTTSVTNGGFEADGKAVTTPAGWTNTVGNMVVNPVFNPPTLNPSAVGSFSAQTSGTTASQYDQTVTGLQAGKNYILSAYVWNRGPYDPSEINGDLATVKMVDPNNSFNNVSMILEGNGTDHASGASGRFMYLLFNQADTATWSGVNVEIISEAGTFAGTRTDPWAQYDNIAITPAETFVAQKWLNSLGGSWSTDGNWLGNVNPNKQTSPFVTSNHAVASFTNGITSNQTVTVDQPRTVGIINFDNPTASYTIGGTNAITFDVTLSGQLTQGVPEIAVVSGSHEISAPIILARNLILDTAPSSTLTLSGDMSSVGFTIFKRNGGTARLKNLRSAGLDISGGGTVQMIPNGTATGVSSIDMITLPLAGKLDLTNNKLVTNTAVGTLSGSAYTGITGQIQTGRNGNATPLWDGATGIITSQTTATTSNLTSIGVATAQQAKSLATATDTAVWAGQTVTGSQTLVMYTYGGDANLDGKINVDDYGRIDLNIPLGTSGWFNGDFNYDGKINVDDYGIIDFNVGIQGTPFFAAGGTSGVGVQAVPEPATLGFAALILGGWAGCRRRQLRR